MSRLLGFLGRFLFYSLVVGLVWWHFLVPWQVALIASTARALPFLRSDQFRIHLEWEETSIQALPEPPPPSLKGPPPPIAGRTLLMNTIPLLALLLSTPGIRWRRKAWQIPLGLLLLHLFQLLHLGVDLYRLFPAQLIDGGLKCRGLKMILVDLAWKFFEQAGSMLAPFVIWVLLCADVVFSRPAGGRTGGG